MKEKLDLSKQDNNLFYSEIQNLNEDSEVSSGTEDSFFNEEDVNLIENKELYNKRNILNGSISFINKFEFMKNSNFLYKFYINNTSLILLMNISSLIFLLFITCLKIIFFLFFSAMQIYDKYMLSIILIFIPFILSTLIKIIILYDEFKDKYKESENKYLMRLLIQKWNIYYSISLFLLSLNLILKIFFVDILNFHYKIIFIIDIFIILFSLIILGIIYYFTKSSNNNILILKTLDKISFQFSISVLLSFVIINFVDQFNNIIYLSSLFCFLLSCISLLLMVYFNDILFSILILIYQMGGINEISFYNMNFHMFCTLINFGFIICWSIKIKKNGKGCLFSNDDNNNYLLIDDETYFEKIMNQ